MRFPVRLMAVEYSPSSESERRAISEAVKGWEVLEKSFDYPDWDELRAISRKGLLIGVNWDTMDYAVIPWKVLGRHVGLFGITGAGKTFFTLSVLTSWILEREANPRLTASAAVVDNLGNFVHLGERVWERFWKDTYSHLGRPGELAEIGRRHVVHYAVRPLPHQREHFVSLRGKTISDLVSYLSVLGARISEEARQVLHAILVQYLDREGFIHGRFRVEYLLEELERQRSHHTQPIIDALRTFLAEYGSENLFRPERPSRKVIVSDASRSPERWIFHHSLASSIYAEVRRPDNLGKFNCMLMVDEYNDILDDAELANSRFTRERREGQFAALFRSFILRLWREGRNYGYSVWMSTQSPFQLLVREGRRLGNVVTRIWGYLGTDVEKMRRLERVELTKYLDVLLAESRHGGWISRPRAGRFIVESDSPEVDGSRVQTFPPLFLQGGR